MTAVMRTESRLGLAREPDEREVQVLLVKEFRRLNDSMNQFLDILKSFICMLLACISPMSRTHIRSRSHGPAGLGRQLCD